MPPIHTVPSRDFARDIGHAKRLAAQGPVFVTDRGKPAYALLTIEDYHRLAGTQAPARSLLDVMDSLPATPEVDFEPGRMDGSVRGADLD